MQKWKVAFLSGVSGRMENWEKESIKLLYNKKNQFVNIFHLS